MKKFLSPFSLFFQIFLWSFMCLGIFVLVKPFDTQTLLKLLPYHTSFLDNASIFLTEYGIYFVLACLYGMLVIQWYQRKRISLFACNISILFAVLIGFLLKQYFQVPRPYLQIEALQPVIEAGFYSFPSNHTILVFAGLFPLLRLSRLWGSLWLVLALLVSFARVYQNVHFPSDIVAGVFVGGNVGICLSHPFVVKHFSASWESREFRRQFAHFWFGIGGLLLHWMLGDIVVSGFLVLAFGGLMISLLSLKYRLPFIGRCLDVFERDKDMKEFPGRGPFYFLLGIIICLLFFPKDIAYASILILSAGDSFNHFFNRQPHHIPLPWNKRKNWYGLGFGILMGTFFGAFFVPWHLALLASSVAITLESFPIRISHLYLNDNVFVPLVSAIILSAFL